MLRESNEKLRKYARAAGVAWWRVADAEGVTEMTMTRRLRRELSEEEKERYMNIIDEIARALK